MDLEKLKKEWSDKNSFPFEELSLKTLLVWWDCDKGHPYESTLSSRLLGRKCNYCAGKKVLIGFNDFASLFPELVKDWDYEKNTLKPWEITSNSAKLFYWKCKNNHEWEASVYSRTSSKKQECIFCSGEKILPGFNDVATLFPEVIKDWDYEKNNKELLFTLSAHSNLKPFWKCHVCSHEWKTSVNHRVNGSGCSKCSTKKRLEKEGIRDKGYSSLAYLHPKLAEQIADESDPKIINSYSHKKILWKCEKGHEWKAQVSSRVKGRNCPYCSNKKILPGFNDLATTHPKLALELAASNNLSASSIINSRSLIEWKCSTCNFIWSAYISDRKRGNGCPNCKRKTASLNQATPKMGLNDAATLTPALIEEWHPLNRYPLSNYRYGSKYKGLWLCKNNHIWVTTIKDRRTHNCPKCSNSVSKPEKEISSFLQEANITLILNSRKIISPYELDIYIPEKNIAIEYNGLYWHSEKFKPQSYHYDKWLACKEQGIQLIQVWEDDWNRNPELVKRMLAQKLGVSTDSKIYARNSLPKQVNKEIAEVFLNTNHVQGFASGSYYLGLFDKRDIEKLVAVIVLKKEPGTNGKTLNIIRYATSQNVVGGFTKLLKYAERTYKPESFVTFSDNCVSDGGLYENNGFVADKNLAPDYMYVVKGERKHKFGYRLKRFSNDTELQYEPGLTERELAALNGLPRVWDAGKTRWVKNTM